MAQAAAGETLGWSFGLKNSKGKYMKCENFNRSLAVASSKMKKNEIFFLETGAAGVVYFRTCLNTFLSCNPEEGTPSFMAISDSKTPETEWNIEAQEDGRWAIKSVASGHYLTADLTLDRRPHPLNKDQDLWNVHLAMHPQICIFSVMRKKFVHLSDTQADSLTTDEEIPWGEDATINLTYFLESGTYGLQASDGRYLSQTGRLEDVPEISRVSVDCQFILNFDGDKVSFRSKATGKYLTSLGASGTLKATKGAVARDELFQFQDSFPQIKLTADNGKKVSIKQGVELAASQTKTTDKECFQVEPGFNAAGKLTWTFKTCEEKFWQLEDGAIHATHVDGTADNCKFEIVWNGNKLAIVGPNGKFIVQKQNSFLEAKGASGDDANANFVYEIINRPKLILRSEYGFVGTLPSGLLECNKSFAEAYNMHITQGNAMISSATSGMYWQVGGNGISATGSEAENYHIELYPESKLAIKAGGKYLQAFQNGDLKATGERIDASTLFEY